MSITPLSWAWRMPLEPRLKLVLLALVDECSEKGFSDDSHRRLAYKTDLTEQAVGDALCALEALDLVNGVGTVEEDGLDDVFFLDMNNIWDWATTPRMKPVWNDSCRTQASEAARARLEGQS